LEGITSALHTDRASILLFDNKHAMRFVAWQGLSTIVPQSGSGSFALETEHEKSQAGVHRGHAAG
jgi:hypothetical protein